MPIDLFQKDVKSISLSTKYLLNEKGQRFQKDVKSISLSTHVVRIWTEIGVSEGCYNKFKYQSSSTFT